MRWLLVAMALFLWVPTAWAEGRWEKDPVSGCEIWAGEPQPDVQVRWNGRCRAGRADGRGTIAWLEKDAGGKTRSYYVGAVKDGRRHGTGSQFDHDGAKYFGDFKNDLPNGSGIYTAPDGSCYEGKFVDGKKHGVGVYTWPDGRRYEGPFVNDVMQGRGVFRYPNGNRYEGEFENGEMHGLGTAYYADGGRYKGPFVHNRQHGEGACLLEDSSWVPCEWKDGEFVRWLD